MILATISGNCELREAEDGNVSFACLSDGREDAAPVAGPVERELVEAACAYADRVSHGQTLGDK